jgi:hypothetical protein
MKTKENQVAYYRIYHKTIVMKNILIFEMKDFFMNIFSDQYWDHKQDSDFQVLAQDLLRFGIQLPCAYRRPNTTNSII